MRLTEEKLSYLLFLYQTQQEALTLTHMAGKLGVGKSTMSKVLSVFYQEGITKEKGKGILSEAGIQLAKKWCTEIEQMSTWLMCSASLSPSLAQQEAMALALHMSEQAKAQLQQHREMAGFLDMLESVKWIYGDMLVAHMEDGEYPFAFTLYKDQIKDKLELSMSNDAFVHPGYLKIEQGKGHLILQSCEMEMKCKQEKALLRGKLEQLSFQKELQFVNAKQWRNHFMIPISHMEFHYSDQERMLQGHIKLQMKPKVQKIEMPESTAILSVVFK